MGAVPPREMTRERERRAWEMRQRGWTITRIADALGIDVSTVSRMLRRVDTRYLETMREAVALLKSEQSSRLEYLYSQAIAAWERTGDSRMLEQARQALADIRRVWGVDAPTKVAATDPSGEKAMVIEVVYSDGPGAG